MTQVLMTKTLARLAQLRTRMHEQRGLEMAEVAIGGLIMAVIVAAGYKYLGSALSNVLHTIADKITNVV